MINGAHVIIYSRDAEADRAFFRDVLKYDHADAGHGWLIFRLPPAELAFHPTDGDGKHELYLMCDDIEALVADMKSKGVPCTEITDQRWGLLTAITLPGGGEVGIYQPKHASPLPGIGV
jgi:catechol 2,3-dioxygenase-like lactoylglutathione lyase family enzyme